MSQMEGAGPSTVAQEPTGGALVVREVARDEVPLLHTLVVELAEYERLAHCVVATHADWEAALFGPGAHAHAALAWEGETLVGYVVWFKTFSTFRARSKLYLEDLYVRPEARGRGYGKALLAWLARRAVADGCWRMHWQVLDWNQPAIGFYERLGAVVTGEWLDCRLDDDALRALAEGAA